MIVKGNNTLNRRRAVECHPCNAGCNVHCALINLRSSWLLEAIATRVMVYSMQEVAQLSTAVCKCPGSEFMLLAAWSKAARFVAVPP